MVLCFSLLKIWRPFGIIIRAKSACFSLTIAFLRTANPSDEFFLIDFADRPELLVNFTSSAEEIEGEISRVTPEGRTALLDAVYLGLDTMRRARNERKVLLIVSDGGENHSRYNIKETWSVVREARSRSTRWAFLTRFQKQMRSAGAQICYAPLVMSPAAGSFRSTVSRLRTCGMIDSALEDRRGALSEAVKGFALTFHSHDVVVGVVTVVQKVCRPRLQLQLPGKPI